MVRGITRDRIETLYPRPDMKEAALRIYNRLPSLLPYEYFLLNEQRPSMPLKINPETFVSTQSCMNVAIPGIDQCLFASTDNKREDSSNSIHGRESVPGHVPNMVHSLGGFASAKGNVGDEIWQFDRNPVAIIARKTSQGYALVGRASLVRNWKPGKQDDWSQLSKEVLWVSDAPKDLDTTPLVSTDIEGLHELMTWVNFDN